MPAQRPMPELGTSSRHAGVAAAYAHRPPYPAEVFEILTSLIVDEPRHVLDLGAGEGALARPLAQRVTHVDAVEISPAMVDTGRRRPGGDQPNLTWILSAAETMPVSGPYALVTAGASLHWMDWDVTFAHIARVLAPGAMLAIVEHGYHRPPWRDALTGVIAAHSRNPTYDPAFSLPDELQRRGLFAILGRRETGLTEFRQPVHDYIEQFHSTSSLARELMSSAEADRFAAEVAEAVGPHANADGELTMRISASVVWGRPAR